MTIDQFQTQFNEACAGLPGNADISFKCISAKAAGQQFEAINSISKVGEVLRVYPDPNTSSPAHVVVEFA